MKTNKQRIVFSLVFMLFALLTLAVADQDKILDELKSIAVIEQKVMVPMRDGVRLATDIYRPKTNEPVPVILSKTPYNFNSWGDGKLNTGTYGRAVDVVKRGYAYAVQNERGRYFSEREWEILGAPRTDGYDAIQRARYREGYAKEVFMEKGKVYKLPVSSMSTSNSFGPGHRIRIEISSSNFPRFARNLNTGGNNYDETVGVVAHNKVHHSQKYPSRIRLSVVKGPKM
jgi:predicted acyl esterase